MKLHKIFWFVFLFFLIISIIVEIWVFFIFRSEGLNLEKYEVIKQGENPQISTVLIRELFRISNGEIGFIVFSIILDLSLILCLEILGKDETKGAKVLFSSNPESHKRNLPQGDYCDDSNHAIFPKRLVCPECQCQIDLSSERQQSFSTICPKCFTEIKIYEVKNIE